MWFYFRSLVYTLSVFWLAPPTWQMYQQCSQIRETNIDSSVARAPRTLIWKWRVMDECLRAPDSSSDVWSADCGLKSPSWRLLRKIGEVVLSALPTRLQTDDTQAYIRMDCKRGIPFSPSSRWQRPFFFLFFLSHRFLWIFSSFNPNVFKQTLICCLHTSHSLWMTTQPTKFQQCICVHQGLLHITTLAN